MDLLRLLEDPMRSFDAVLPRSLLYLILMKNQVHSFQIVIRTERAAVGSVTLSSASNLDWASRYQIEAGRL